MTSLAPDLFSLFLQALPEESAFDHAQLKIAVENFIAKARLVHPTFAEVDNSFLKYVSLRLPGHFPVEQELARLQVGDLLLAKYCADGDATAINVFECEFLPLVSAAGRKLRMSDDQCQELRQAVRLKLLVTGINGSLPKIANFAGTGPLRSWVYATGLRTGLNELRRIGRAPIPAGDEQLLVAMPDKNDDQELQYMKELYRTSFKQAFRDAIDALPTRLANVLRHYYLDELTLEEIGTIYRVHKTTVMRWVNKAHAELESTIKAKMISKLNMKESEVESVLRLIQSGVQLGLASVLALNKD